MRHELDIDELTPQKLDAYLQERKLRSGDELKLKSSREKGKAIAGMISLIAWILLYLLKRYSDQKEGDKRLQELFQRTSVEELEELMQEEYGVKISFEQKEARGEDETDEKELTPLQKKLLQWPTLTDEELQEIEEKRKRLNEWK